MHDVTDYPIHEIVQMKRLYEMERPIRLESCNASFQCVAVCTAHGIQAISLLATWFISTNILVTVTTSYKRF